MSFYVYIILCEGGSFYTGYTKDLKLRMKCHIEGRGARYTRIHKPERLVYVEVADSIADAMRREGRIKRLNHRQKITLINGKG